MYCELLSFHTSACLSGGQPDQQQTGMYLLEFWSRVTPSLLLLMEHDGRVSGGIAKLN